MAEINFSLGNTVGSHLLSPHAPNNLSPRFHDMFLGALTVYDYNLLHAQEAK